MPQRLRLISVLQSPGGVAAAATLFIAEHTTPVSVADGDCPICLEDLTQLDDVRVLKINDVAGCRHILCEACIGKILNYPTNADKECPSCKAVWMTGTAGQAVGNPVLAQVGDGAHEHSRRDPTGPVRWSPLSIHSQDRALNMQLNRCQRRRDLHEETAARRATDRASRDVESSVAANRRLLPARLSLEFDKDDSSRDFGARVFARLRARGNGVEDSRASPPGSTAVTPTSASALRTQHMNHIVESMEDRTHTLFDLNKHTNARLLASKEKQAGVVRKYGNDLNDLRERHDQVVREFEALITTLEENNITPDVVKRVVHEASKLLMERTRALEARLKSQVHAGQDRNKHELQQLAIRWDKQEAIFKELHQITANNDERHVQDLGRSQAELQATVHDLHQQTAIQHRTQLYELSHCYAMLQASAEASLQGLRQPASIPLKYAREAELRLFKERIVADAVTIKDLQSLNATYKAPLNEVQNNNKKLEKGVEHFRKELVNIEKDGGRVSRRVLAG